MAASTRDILSRIKGINSTKQITRAMEMVAAVKLNRVRSRAENSRFFVNHLGTMLRALRSSEKATGHPLFSQREGNHLCVVMITSDRGLCGTFNLNMVNAVQEFLDNNQGKDVSMVCVGKKGYDAFSRRSYNITKFFHVPWGDTFLNDLRTINTFLTQAYNQSTVNEIHLFYTQFVNVLKYLPTPIKLLPLAPLAEEEKIHLIKGEIDFIWESSFDKVAQSLVPRFIETRLHHCLIESSTSEHAARMVSMRNATDNATEMIKDLTLSFNKARQSSITKELIDIIGGVEALT